MKMRVFISALLAMVFLFLPETSQARWYSPSTGRFHTMDTFQGNSEEPATQHKYLYCQANPVNNTDPSGHEIEGLLSVMSITSTIFAQISPATAAVSSTVVSKDAKRPLTQGEIGLAQTIYGANINYTKSGVNYGKWKIWQTKGREMTPKGIIFTGGVTINDYTEPGNLNTETLMGRKGTFIHEMCHVWQFQTGINVILQGAYRKYEYAGPNFGRLAFKEYGIEQQAQMTEDYYLLRNGYSSTTVPKPMPELKTYEGLLPFLPK